MGKLDKLRESLNPEAEKDRRDRETRETLLSAKWRAESIQESLTHHAPLILALALMQGGPVTIPRQMLEAFHNATVDIQILATDVQDGIRLTAYPTDEAWPHMEME